MIRFLPSSRELTDLIQRAQAIAPAVVCGFVRAVDDHRVAVLAPTPKVKVITATAVKPGRLSSIRTP